MSYKTVEIGLPFFDDINKQVRFKPYYNSDVKEWICSNINLPAFQFLAWEESTELTILELTNIDTGGVTSYLSHFNTYGGSTGFGVQEIVYYYGGTTTLSPVLPDGKYYLYAKDDLEQEWWSEVFVVRDLNITANPSAIEFDTIEIGLPFFDNINKQMRYSPYYNSHIKSWLSADNRILPFQISSGTVDGIATFNLINSITGVVTDYKAYFDANTIETLVDGEYYYTHLGLKDVVVSGGRYYFYAVGTGGRKWWSEEFVMCGDIIAEIDYLLISASDYLLISAADKLIIG